jgi:hypothetical protein
MYESGFSVCLWLRTRNEAADGVARYITDQGPPCPLLTLNPFGRELLLLDVFTGIKWSTWIQRIYMTMVIVIVIVIVNAMQCNAVTMTMTMRVNKSQSL